MIGIQQAYFGADSKWNEHGLTAPGQRSCWRTSFAHARRTLQSRARATHLRSVGCWPSFEPVPPKALLAVILNGLIGSALCYYLWYTIVGYLPATTASLGSLSSPAIGVVASALLLGEYPTTGDIIGFGLIFAAAMSVILQPRPRQLAAPATAPAETKR